MAKYMQLKFKDHIRRRRNDLIRRIARSRLFVKATDIQAIPPDAVVLGRSRPDHLIHFNPHDDIGRHLLRHGDFYRGAVRNVVSLLSTHNPNTRNKALLEIGANIGTQTIYFCLEDYFHKVFAIEPVEANIALLKQNIGTNGLNDRVELVETAIWKTNGAATINLDAQNSGAHSMIGTDSGKTSEIQTMTIDRLFHDKGIQPCSLGLVWIDAEGAEPEIISQLAAAGVSPSTHSFFVEFSPMKYDSETTENMLQSFFGKADRLFAFKRNDYAETNIEKVRKITTQADILLLPPN